MEVFKRSSVDLTDEKFHFQGRWECLDWKKIASIDIDSILQGSSDTSQLLELINSVTFCKADSEFDHGRTDPAFIKVFRVSQLISEYLLLSQERSVEKLTALQEKYNELEKERSKLSQENSQLKESLGNAKKELKKRREMIASTQSEILGQNNGDEYDQCPYCIKKFLSRAYLLAHIQRRHQGLPLPVAPYYPCFHHPFGYAAAATGGAGGGGEGCLEGGGNGKDYWKRALEETEMNVMQMQDELETRCKNLEQKMKQNGNIEGKKSEPDEVSILKVASTSSQADVKVIPSSKEEEDVSPCPVETRGQHPSNNASPETGEVTKSPSSETKKREEIEELKSTLVASVQDEIKSLLSRLESQEQFWQDKLASVHENHERQIQQLRQELQFQIKPIHPPEVKLIPIQHNKATACDCELDKFSQLEHENGSKGLEKALDYPSPKILVVGPGNVQPHQFLRNGASGDNIIPRNYAMDKSTNTPKSKPLDNCGVQNRLYHEEEAEKISQVESPKLHESLSDLERYEIPAKLTKSQNQNQDEKTVEERPCDKANKPPKATAKDLIKEVIVTKKSPRLEDNNVGKISDNELSDYTLSDSPLELDEEPSNSNSSGDEEAISRSISLLKKSAELISQERGIPSVKGTGSLSKEKKPISSNTKSLKLVKEAVGFQQEISSVDDEDDDEFSGGKEDFNWTSADELDDDDDDDDYDSSLENMRDKEKKKRRFKLIRAKTMSELDKNINDIGLDPADTAIGPEEMGKALKHLKLKRQISCDQIQDFEKFQKERNSVKTFTKFEATRSSIDEKLDEICNQSLKRPDKSSYVRIFSAVKASGKKFKKRVKSNILPFSLKH